MSSPPPAPVTGDTGGHDAWNPGVSAEIPHPFRPLESIVRAEHLDGSGEDACSIAELAGLAAEELAAFSPMRLALHELIVRVTADVAIAEGDEERRFGENFRRVTLALHAAVIEPRSQEIVRTWEDLRREALGRIRDLLRQALAEASADGPRRPFLRSLFGRPTAAAPAVTPIDREQAAIAEFHRRGPAAADPLERALCKSLYRVLAAMLARRGRLIGDHERLAGIVLRHLCNSFGSERIGDLIAAPLAAAIEAAGYPRAMKSEAPILVSLKGASAAGKSSLRPMIKRLLAERGVAAESYATISPDVWRRLLLDFDALGPARKYAGHLTGRELRIIDGKLDRYIRKRAEREGGIPHLLVDRFRFDSFASEQIGRVLHDTYARHVDTMYMYFVVTPPAETVVRGWRRGLERGRYKAVEDFLGHSIEASEGMPRIFFKWVASPRPEYRYVFLDNRVPRGEFPKTIAEGDRRRIRIADPLALVELERYRKTNVHAASPSEIYPHDADLSIAGNCGFLRAIVRRIPEVDFTAGDDGSPYLRCRNGRCETVDAAGVAALDAETRAAVATITALLPAQGPAGESA